MKRLLVLTAAALAAPLHAAAPPPAALHQRIDHHVGARKDFRTYEAPRSGDAEFVRRLYLDLTGKIPSAQQTREFLASASPTKRRQLIDRLLASPEHARHLATVFDVMLMERLPDQQAARPAWMEFLRSSFEKNVPWDVTAREILAGDDPDGTRRHRVKFFVERKAEPNLVTRDVSRLFLGTNLQCAQCHDHPLIEDYKQDQYYGLLAFVGRSSLVPNAKTKVTTLSEKADGETTFQSVFDPKKVTRTAVPRVPGGKAFGDPAMDKAKAYVVAPAAGVPAVPKYSRRALLATAVAAGDYAPFRRNIANRLWALMMGRGLVDPVDMDHGNNPPSHPELLDELSSALAAKGFDVRWYLRELALSETYQRSSEPPAKAAGKAPLYATALLKPLTPEQLAWSLMEATGVVETNRLALAKGATEAALYARLSPNVTPFVQKFSSPAGQTQTFDASMDQALFVANGPLVRSWLAARPGSLVDRLAKLKGDAVAEELYLSVFCRPPDAEEKREVAEYLKGRPAGHGDLVWALMASTEFRFNH